MPIYDCVFLQLHILDNSSYQMSLNQSKSDFEAAQLEWKENQGELHLQIAALEEDKTRLEGHTSLLSSQLQQVQSNLEQLEKSSKQGVDEVRVLLRNV